MAGEIHITKDFPPAREKAVLLELLNLMRALQQEDIDAVIVAAGSHSSKSSPTIRRPVIP